ncbi:MAG: phosphate-starvation-inducible PsiE family protein, partial [Paraclostridium dentum]
MKKLAEKSLALKIAYIFESLLAMVVLLAVFLGTIDVLRMIWHSYIVEYRTPVQYAQFNDLLGQILLLVIGVELVVMLSLHIPGALIEVLLYAIARKLLLLPKS